jgi:hypothetical protein
MELGSSIKSGSVGSGVGIEVGETVGSGESVSSGVTVGSGNGVKTGSGATLITGVGEASGIAGISDTCGSEVKARISVTGTAETCEGAGVRLALTATTATSSDLGNGTWETETEFSGKFSLENSAPAVPSELPDSSLSTDENSEPAEDPPTTKVVSKAAVSFEEVFTL